MIGPDFKKYRQMIENPELSDEQKDEFIIALWSVIAQFVDQSFGDHPLQLSQKCSKTRI